MSNINEKKKIKKENSEFFKYLRESYLKREDFRNEVINAYESKNKKIDLKNILVNASLIIEFFVKYGKNQWVEAKSNVEKNWIELYLTETDEFQKKFPSILKIINEAIDIDFKNIEKKEILIHASKILSPLVSKLVISNSNSAKSLAGSALEVFIMNLLDIAKIKYDYQVSFDKGEVLDFIFPNRELAEQDSEDCISVESQQTLKDRFRLSLGKLKKFKKIQKFIATVSGKGLITDSDKSDLSKAKIDEISRAGVKLIVLKSVKDDLFMENNNVLSYEEFFNIIYSQKKNK